MGKKNQGIKRGSDAHKMRQYDLLTRKQMQLKEHRDGGMMIAEEELMLALAEMGFRTSQFYELNDRLTVIRKERRMRAVEDFKDDKDMWFTKAKIDAELNACLPPVMQMTWEQRHDEERHTLGLRCGPADNRPEEGKAYFAARSEYLAERRMAQIKREQNKKEREHENDKDNGKA